MAPTESSLTDRIKTIGAAITAISGLLAAVPGLFDNVRSAVKSATALNLNGWAWLAIALGLLVLGALLSIDKIKQFFKELTKQSRLRRPEALWLRADNPEHLIGREEDVERLTRLSGEFSLIFLVGESGSGKSALLQAGLVPGWTGSDTLFPIYLDVWGEDWVKGPRQSLCESLWESLSPEQREVLGLNGSPRPADHIAFLRSFREKLGRTPVLLLDQFDDYQSRHQALFLPPRRKTWLPVEDLVKKNAFWGDLKSMLGDGAIRCVIATRADAADGLESVRLVPPRAYRLERLRTLVVGPLLNRLAGQDGPAGLVVEAPEAGWNRLKERLARDLDQDGAILPVQMRMAFRGLAAIPALTPRAYEREGTLRGIEAAHIEQQISNTALNSGLGKPQVLALLLALVDREKRKTLSRAVGELKEALLAQGPAGDQEAIEEGVPIALEFLQDREIVRRRLDPDTRGHVWLLDHDYLSNGILEAERRANAWLSLLQEKFRSYEDAGARFRRKWWALLSPLQQVGLVYQNFRGRLSYGRYRHYALLSLVRWAPYLLLVILGVFGWRWTEERRQAQRDHDEARAILSALATEAQTEALWKLASSSDAVRFSFLEQALANPGDCRRIDQNPTNVLQALVGLESARKEEVIKNLIVLINKNPHITRNLNLICDASVLLISSAAQDRRELASTLLIGIIAKTTDPFTLAKLGEGLGAVAGRLDPADARKASDAITAAMEKSDNPTVLGALGAGLGAMAGRLDPADARKTSDAIITAMEKATDPTSLRPLAGALGAMAGRLDPADARKASDAIIACMEKITDHYALGTLGAGLGAMAGRLDPADARKASDAIIACMEKITDHYALGTLAGALGAVAGRLDPADARKASDAIIACMEKATDPSALGMLGGGLGAMAGKLDPADARKASDAIIAAIEKTTNPIGLAVLAGGLWTVPGKLDHFYDGVLAADVRKASDAIIAAIEKTNDPSALGPLGRGLKAVAGKLDPADARKASDAIITAIEKTTDSYALGPLAGALGAVPVKLDPADARKASDAIIAAIEKTDDRYALGALAGGLKAVPGVIDTAALVNLAKFPSCVGDLRVAVLEIIERQNPPAKFEGDVWKMVEWARQQKPTLDLSSPPRRAAKP